MPDITMCQVDNCPQKNKCYRATFQASYRQSYFADDPRKDSWHSPSECDYFVAVEPIELKTVVKINPLLLQHSSGSIGHVPGLERVLRPQFRDTYADRELMRVIHEGLNHSIYYRFPFLGKLRKRLLKFLGIIPIDAERKFVIRCWVIFGILVVICFCFLIKLLY